MEYNIKEEVYKCSKCGLCQSVCPIYLATRNEMYLPRGRFVVLNNFFNNKKKLSKKFIQDLDLCLNCSECKNFCPSAIDSRKIFTLLKNSYNYRYSIFSFSFLYKLILKFHNIKGSIFRLFNLNNNLYNITVKRKKSIKPSETKGKVLFFEGCFNKYINSSDKNAALNIIESLGYDIINSKFFCCGYPYLCDGNIEKYKQNISDFINSVEKDCKYIICSCDSCMDSLLKIKDFLPEQEVFCSKIISFDEFLKLNNFKINNCSNNYVYHKPLLRQNECYLPNIKTINRKGACSLTENFFILKHRAISELLLKNTFYKKEEIAEKDIITTCQLSKWGLIKASKANKINCKVLSYPEFINNVID